MTGKDRPDPADLKPETAAGKPLFIDKPLAANLREAMEIFELAREANVSATFSTRPGEIWNWRTAFIEKTLS